MFCNCSSTKWPLSSLSSKELAVVRSIRRGDDDEKLSGTALSGVRWRSEEDLALEVTIRCTADSAGERTLEVIGGDDDSVVRFWPLGRENGRPFSQIATASTRANCCTIEILSCHLESAVFPYAVNPIFWSGGGYERQM